MPATLRKTEFVEERQLQNFDILSADGKVVGMAQLRLKASKGPDMPEGFESNVYYEVDPQEQGKSYATDCLKELIKIAAAHDIDPLIATVNEDNIPSIKVIEKCGGQLAAQAKNSKGVEVRKYEISIESSN